MTEKTRSQVNLEHHVIAVGHYCDVFGLAIHDRKKDKEQHYFRRAGVSVTGWTGRRQCGQRKESRDISVQAGKYVAVESSVFRVPAYPTSLRCNARRTSSEPLRNKVELKGRATRWLASRRGPLGYCKAGQSGLLP